MTSAAINQLFNSLFWKILQHVKEVSIKKILNDTASCQDSVEEGESSETSLIYKPSQNKWMKPKQTEV